MVSKGLDIKLTDEKKDSRDRVKQAQARKKDSEFEPTWEEVWFDGFTRPTGTFKKAIFEMNNSEPDVKRLDEVRLAVENGLIGTGVDNLTKFTKTHALRLYAKVKDMKQEQIVEDMLENKPDNYYLINTLGGLHWVTELLLDEDVIALDTETTGLHWEDVTVGISLTLPKNDVHVYIPYRHDIEEQLSPFIVLSTLDTALTREDLMIVMFNAKFDIHMLEKEGVDLLDNFYFDPMTAMHVLNENEERYALKPLANKYGKYFGYEDESLSFDELFSKDPKDFIGADIMLATIYACKDTELTYLLYKWQDEHLRKQDGLYYMYYEIEKPITKVSVEMERNGMLMDLDFTKEYGKELIEQIKELEDEIYENWGDININSPSQLKEKLFNELGYEDISGKGSTNKDVLEELAVKHKDVEALLDYRDLNKVYTTYVDTLPDKVRQDLPEYSIKGDGRLHGNFNQSGTVTGRFSSNGPNLQNIPDEARKMFVAPEGKLIIGIDYS